MSDYYNKSNNPVIHTPGSSTIIKNEFSLIESAFDKLPPLLGNIGNFLQINSTGSGINAVPEMVSDADLSTDSGYYKIPGENNLIFQWVKGKTRTNSGISNITYPVLFPNRILIYHISPLVDGTNVWINTHLAGCGVNLSKINLKNTIQIEARIKDGTSQVSVAEVDFIVFLIGY